MNPKAAKAAARWGADISGYVPETVTPELLGRYDVALCMTEAQADALAEAYPAFDERLLCLGETDIAPPALDTLFGWQRAADRVEREVAALLDELLGAEDDEDT